MLYDKINFNSHQYSSFAIFFIVQVNSFHSYTGNLIRIFLIIRKTSLNEVVRRDRELSIVVNRSPTVLSVHMFALL